MMGKRGDTFVVVDIMVRGNDEQRADADGQKANIAEERTAVRSGRSDRGDNANDHMGDEHGGT